jgi:hypothetical protein
MPYMGDACVSCIWKQETLKALGRVYCMMIEEKCVKVYNEGPADLKKTITVCILGGRDVSSQPV